MSDQGDLDAILVEASRLMKHGIDLRMEQPIEALACFDRALDLRRRLPIDQVPVLRYDLAACWLNRAEVLALLGTDDDSPDAAVRAAEALQAYEEALALLRTLPLHEDPRFARRLAIAWQNRGRLLVVRAQHPSDIGDAVAAFMAAIAVLDRDGALVPDRQPMAATIWMNVANAWMSNRDPESAIQASRAARLAIALIAPLEPQDADAAEVGLNARHILCRALSVSTLAPTSSAAVPLDDIHDATDAADEALALIEQWERQGITRFRELACDLFRFGAHVYAAHQPAFLAEFLQEHLDPARSSSDYVESAPMRRAADETASLRQPSTYYVRLTVQID
jgi:tetratricopeptide (TPR) repeat protein